VAGCFYGSDILPVTQPSALKETRITGPDQ